MTQRRLRHGQPCKTGPSAWATIITLTLLLTLLVTPTLTFAQEDEEEPRVGLQAFAEGFVAPVDFQEAPDGSGRFFIVDQVGVVWLHTADGTMEEPFLDIRDRVVELNPDYDERGLLALEFHPDFANNGRFFVYYTGPLSEDAPPEWNSTNHLSEFTVSADDANRADPNSERILYSIDKPQGNHNGGDLSFGPDGYLYLPLGDGGGGDDTGEGHTPDIGNGQDVSNALGSILRIDVDNGDPYGIPEDNPFAGVEGVPPETWAWGFRNPWRATWDSNGRYFVADAGQELWEEVSIVQGNSNYGWNIREGTHCFTPEHPAFSPFSCAEQGANGEPLQAPILQHSHLVGVVNVGGYLYEGSAIANLGGNYVFGVWSAGGEEPDGALLYAVPPPAEAESSMWQMLRLPVDGQNGPHIGMYVLAFGRDASGELYVLTSTNEGPSGNTGAVWKIVPAGEATMSEPMPEAGGEAEAVAPAETPEAGG